MESPWTVVVTGASRGIGRAVALAFVAHGDDVWALGRDPQALQEVTTAATGLSGSLQTIKAETRDRSGLPVALTAIDRPIDVLVVNAGISERTALDRGPEADAAWLALIDTNLTGAWLALRAAAPHFASPAAAVLVSSDLGRMGAPAFAGYAASKHALIGLCRSLALELGPRRISLNAVCPGWVETAMAERSLQEIAHELQLPAATVAAAEAEALPLGRFIRPAEVADLILHLASPAGRTVTGQVWGIDAGTTPFA